MANDSELEAEQAYIDHAYERLEASRRAASRMSGLVEVGRGGTEQARYEREVIYDTMSQRLAQLDLGNQALCFGRIDRDPRTVVDDDSGVFYVGRVAVADHDHEPLIVDWRAPVAEPFYRATGRDPMGLARRRHFATRGRTVLGLEDELFGEVAQTLGIDGTGQIKGEGALIAAIETNRAGKLGDIVATIQGEQDEVIRAPLPGVLVVQGGPGTGKTVVALHRAAYLIYTHRFPLEGQGVLVIGPNRLFLGYIDQVLPSLGEAGVELAVLADLLADRVSVRGRDHGLAARVKGDVRMAKVLARAVRDRQQPLRDELVVGYGARRLRVSRDESRRIVGDARRRARKHNAGRRFVEQELFAALAASAGEQAELDPEAVREQLVHTDDLRVALEWMWPVLTPAQLLNDLFGSAGLLRHAARDVLDDDEWQALERTRRHDADDIRFTFDDVPVLDEARALLGPRPRRRKAEEPRDDEVRTYGHVVVDEAQDLSPMQLRMVNRRSLNGSMTVVGDIAQATGAWAHEGWDEILELLPDRHEPRRAELTIGYRLTAPIMSVAARVLRHAAPNLTPPSSIREDGEPPRFVGVGSADQIGQQVARVVDDEVEAVGVGSVAVICPESMALELSEALDAAGIVHGQATRHGLDQQVTVVAVGLVKGLELDASIVVEPAGIVDEADQGPRALYVALTRSTRRLTIVHARPLPDELEE
jgi:DNA helicase IV